MLAPRPGVEEANHALRGRRAAVHGRRRDPAVSRRRVFLWFPALRFPAHASLRDGERLGQAGDVAQKVRHEPDPHAPHPQPSPVLVISARPTHETARAALRSRVRDEDALRIAASEASKCDRRPRAARAMSGP